jgi:26S proteasome non-ATPase regulatory subunit 9
VDVAACRADRHLLAVLSTDHKALSARLEAALHALHATARSGGGGGAGGGFAAAAAPPRRAPRADAPEMVVDEAGRVASAIAVPAASVHPFAVVDEVAEGGPAAEAGVQVGDAVVRFGHATAQSPAPMAAVAAALAAAEGGAVEAVVRRRGGGAALMLTLALRPRAWAGRGLLGCHLAPLGGRER